VKNKTSVCEDYFWDLLNDPDHVSLACGMLLELRGQRVLAREVTNPALSEHDELVVRLRGLRALEDRRALGAMSRLIDEAYDIDARYVIRCALRAVARSGDGAAETLAMIARGFASDTWVRKLALETSDALRQEGRARFTTLEEADRQAYLWLDDRRKRAGQAA
jgi:hypothetical protein